MIMSDPENRDGVPVLIGVPSKKTARVIRVNITLPEDVLAKIDARAEHTGMNRSGFLVYAAKREMEST